MGKFVTGLFGAETDAEKQQRRFATYGFENRNIQKFLPPSLQQPATAKILGEGIQGIGELIRNPGGLSPNVSEAILPRLAAESESITQNYRGIGSQQVGALARGNAPISIKSALQSALDVAQERAQRGARREALTSSEALRREDLGQTFKILDAILQFLEGGRGQFGPGLAAAAQSAQQRQAATQALVGSLISSFTGGGVGK